MPGSFLDTNIVLYLVSGNLNKADQAERIASEGGTISVQVLNEIASVARRKMKMSWAEMRSFLSLLCSLFAVQPLTVKSHQLGLGIAKRYGFSIFDSMIAASALEAGCDTLWSEDMQDRLLINGRLRDSNPFR